MEESLNVGELTRILGLAQSTVSKHLGELRKAALVEGVRNGSYAYYRLSERTGDLWESLSTALSSQGRDQEDLARLEEILKQREERSEVDRFVVPGRSWMAWSRALGYLLSPLRVADFGCGDGAFTVEMARWAKEVYAIDCNLNFLKMAQERVNGAKNVHFFHQDMERLSLGPSVVDLVVISQSLHYVLEPKRVLREAHRILVKGGRVLLVDLLPHEEEWVISELGHRWLGFEPKQLTAWLGKVHFRQVRLEAVSKRGPERFHTVLATGLKK